MTEQNSSPAAELQNDAKAGPDEASKDEALKNEEVLKKNKKKKDKVRSAWISFAGRILAQIVGAVATVVLTLTVLHQYKGVDTRPSKEPVASAKRSEHAVAARPADENAVAVLPMENFSAESGHDYLADGMTETLIADLTKVGGLHVISRTSSMHFKGHKQTLREIAEELGVKWIIEGSIVKAGERVRITAQLIDAATDQHKWAESYDRPLTDLLAMQAEVASAIASAVTAVLPGFPRSGQTATATPGVVLRPVRPL
jgi:TolB-like protein